MPTTWYRSRAWSRDSSVGLGSASEDKRVLASFCDSSSSRRLTWALCRFAAARVGDRLGLGKLAPLVAPALTDNRNVEGPAKSLLNDAKGSRSDSAIGGVAAASLGNDEPWLAVTDGLVASSKESFGKDSVIKDELGSF